MTVDLRNNTVSGGHGEGDVITNVENITGTNYRDVLRGDSGANTLQGLDGDDDLAGGAGADRLDGGGGIDWIRYLASDTGVMVNLEQGTGQGGDAEGDVIVDVEKIEGSHYRDVLVGDNDDNGLAGREGDDDLRGNGGRDDLEGDAGADRLDGGAGSDWIIYWGSDAGVKVDLEQGTGEGGHAQGDVIIDVENVMGSRYSDELLGNNEANFLQGLEGADRLDGGGGIDSVGYWHSDAGVTVNLEAGTGKGGEAEGDVITDVEDVTGSRHRDELRGDNGPNFLDGRSGDDALYGNGGDDELWGGSGADRLEGGNGADKLYGNEDADRLEGGNGADKLYGHEGADRLVGGGGADKLFGNEGADVFIFAAGHGDDTIYDFRDNEDKVDLSAFDLAGFDDLTLSSASGGVTIDLTEHGGGTILLQNIDLAALDAADFIF